MHCCFGHNEASYVLFFSSTSWAHYKLSRSTTKHSEFGLAASVCLAISQLANQLNFIHFKDMKMSTPSKSQCT